MDRTSDSPDTGTHERPALQRRGLMFILSSPSGAGKTTIARKLLTADPALALSVSATTRPMRPGEVDGRDYHFVSREKFDAMIDDSAFLEWAHVFGHSYGTPKSHIWAGLKEGQDFLFDIDWQGTQQLHQRAEADVVPVFILPPSIDELRRRLTARATDDPQVIDARMERARAEISHWHDYQYVVVNDDIDACYRQVRQILEAERLRRARQTGLVRFVRELTEDGNRA
ncbi:guanylate kinase [Croceicoccus sp. YJ47]|uniref:guanylate kinase n=1 Tax=Croceicoccus sp. YJ47 TaxID=2798724 RepID=UPI0019220D6B|nr:guanylate kinase [Croceicoccus sp. YJ47]QQN74588.1 guanylate kinase [Croceicoccus sp. YJ47]